MIVDHETLSHVLTPEGSQIVELGSHEARVWAALPAKGEGSPLTPMQSRKQVGYETAKVGQGRAFKNGWIGKEGDGFVQIVPTIQDATQVDLREIALTGTFKAGEKVLADLRKRKLIIQRKGQWLTVKKGPYFSTSTAKPETDLTMEMLTAPYILADPKEALPPEPEYYKRVSTVREDGGFGATGYRAPWSHEESSKLLLRTHTTASSAHMPCKLAAKCRGENVEGDAEEFAHGSSTTGDGPDDGFRPEKLFSIDQVFINETMDATHLAEFHQVKGVVADRNLTLVDLIALSRNLRLSPHAHRWVEVGNSGMFRPEMFEPMGFPKDVRVHGLGLSLERPTMIR
ncbi:hypothetical protein C0989_004704 [Termitomyces sp. Mn162]|nr:hypothetical protein C0989_004704 [Termitomyces sp. Mn162]